jgi:chromosome segregation ATPase
MSDERRETIDLAYIGRALQRLTSEVAGLRDDMGVLTSIVLRHEETLVRINEQITAMVRQHRRIVDRLRTVEERGDGFEERLGEINERLDALEGKPRG